MPDAVIRQIAIGPMMNFSYLIGDNNSGICAVIDPGWDASSIKTAAEKEGWKIEMILLTHAHFDHANAVEDLAGMTSAPVYIHASEMDDIPSGIECKTRNDGTTITMGNIKINCLHTPGHTPGSQCFLVNGAIFTGDTLFVDGCGRVDLPGSDPGKMIVSLRRLAKLDPATVVYPGHDYGNRPASTIGEQLESNPCLNAGSENMLI